MKRIYHSYDKLEETKAGLWRRPTGSEREALILECGHFMANTAAFRSAMVRAIHEWPISCEQNFSTKSINRQAWLGHAACCIAIGCPEEPTRAAWWTLTQSQRDAADAAAEEVIKEWETMEREKANQRIRVFWRAERNQWCVTLPGSANSLFHQRRWSEAIAYAFQQAKKVDKQTLQP